MKSESRQHRCIGITANLRRCGRIGDWRFFCGDHSRQPLVWLFTLVFTVIAGTASIYSVMTSDPVDVPALVEKIIQSRQLAFDQREQAYQDQIKSLTEAVKALAQQKDPGIKEALAQLAQGDTEAAEKIFENLLRQKSAEGRAANQQAAEAARHLGALAFLHDTQKAIQAYRQAVKLDPDNASGWNQLGHLLKRIGDLSGSEEAYQKVLTSGESTKSDIIKAVAYGNLGILYQTRGELDQAEAMYRKALEIDEALGRKEGMANQYGNLGILYQTRGELDQAEAMYRKALEIQEALGLKEGMASQYGNLGILYQTRGELDQAETIYRKSLLLFQQLGAAPQVKQVQNLLETLNESRN